MTAAAQQGTLGGRLRSLRTSARLSLAAVESLSAGEFKPAALGSYERDERHISVDRLLALVGSIRRADPSVWRGWDWLLTGEERRDLTLEVRREILAAVDAIAEAALGGGR